MLNRKFIVAGLLAAALPGVALAEDPPKAPEPPKAPYTLSANAYLVSDYFFRGITQTWGKPAIQGGFDFVHDSGIYLGTWASNVSGNEFPGGSMEWDLYGGYKYAINDDWGLDVGALYYYYPGSYLGGVTNPDTTELYLAGSWKWASLKYSHAVSNTFGIPDSHNSWYLDLSANYPITDALTLNAHVGRQEYKGSTNGFNNGDTLNYTDWKLGLTWAVNSWNLGAYYTDTNAKDAGYTLAGRNIGKATGTVFVQRTF